MNNPFVDFLAAYGPTASSNNIYDEFVSKQARKTGCNPLEIEQPLINELYEILTSHQPRSVILTGTAGDGKTYVARKILEAIIPGKNWENTQKTFEISTPNNGRKLTFIKDLSELNKADKERISDAVYQSLTNQSPDLFLVCVNDGHLLYFLRKFIKDKTLHSKISNLLLDHDRKRKDDNFELINMSLESNNDTLLKIIKEISNHPGWNDCNGCPALNSEHAPCPIRLNLRLIEQDGKHSMKKRLQEMINLAAFDGNHLSIRQLILLVVNIILGDQKNARVTNKELLNCKRAQIRADKNEYEFTNPYSNVFGSNLSKQAQNNFKVFSTLVGFGVGYETNNFFDRGLISKQEAFLPQGIYSLSIFEKKLAKYLESPNQFKKEFHTAIVAQRQRMFFSENEHWFKDSNSNPWNLTTFKRGNEYLNLLPNDDQGDREFQKFKAKLFKSFNRMMTGELTDTSNEVWLVAPTGVFAGHSGSLLVRRMGLHMHDHILLRILASKGYGKPLLMSVELASDSSKKVDFEITPTFFEYLLRIAEGALPASFPTDFQQAVQRFQIKVMSLYKEETKGGYLSSQVELASQGNLQEKPITVLLQERTL